MLFESSHSPNLQYRIFEQVIATVPADESEDLLLVLSASKCLDLLITLQIPEFQMYALCTSWIS